MTRKRYTEEQIINILKEAAAVRFDEAFIPTPRKGYPYDLERKIMCHQCTERVQEPCIGRLKTI